MPGPALHHMIADRLKEKIFRYEGLGSNTTPEQYKALKKLLEDPKNLPYLFFGSQGPDYLFFNTKDMPGPIGEIADFYFDVIDFVEEFQETLKSVVPQQVLDMLEGIDEFTDEVIEDSSLLSELEQTFGDINQVLDGFAATLMAKVQEFISEFNLFDLLGHPYGDGVNSPNEKWWWFDVLHYRKTGKFAQKLLKETLKDLNDPKCLYALGHLTHYCADTVGHPYVNLFSGGPYRSHAQRHKTGENYQDVFNLDDYLDKDWNRSKLHALYNFNFDGRIDTENDEPDPYTKLPDDLAKLIAKSIREVYQEDEDPQPEYGTDITAEDVNDAYRIFYKWLKNSTDLGTLPEPVPYSFSAEMREVWEKAMDNLEDVGDFLQDITNTAGGMGIWGIFLFLPGLIIGAVLAAAAIADLIAGGIATLSTATIRAAACIIYEQLYDAYKNFRLGIAMNGLGFPMKEHLNHPALMQFANPANPDPTGLNAAPVAPHLPLLKYKPRSLEEIVLHQERHLYYPTTQNEKDHVMGMLDSYLTQPSTHFAFGEIPFHPQNILDRLESLTPDDNPINNDDGSQLKDIPVDKSSLGSAMKLIEKCHERFQKGKNLIDFNLDGDRGYSYVCWAQRQRSGVDAPDFPGRLKVNHPGGDPSDDNISVKLNFLK